jgi:Cu/Ag efflux protein CusF
MNVARKSILPILGAATFFFVSAIRAGAQDSTNQVRSSAETAREEARQRRAKMPIAKGTIKEIDLLRHQLKLVTEDGLRTFTYTSRTYIFRDKEKITADNLKVGEIVALSFNTDKDGNVLVQRIKARTPAELMEPPSTGPADVTNSPAVSHP